MRCKRCRTRLQLPAERDPEQLLRELEDHRRERMHHYVFAHRILPEVAFTDPNHVLELLKSDKGTPFLSDLWEEVGRACPRPLEADGLEVSVQALGGCEIILVQLPTPVVAPEAHYLALVHGQESRFFGLVKRPRLRCFTLERSIRLAGGTRTVICEWTWNQESGLEHNNYGAGPPANAQDFLGSLAGILAG